MLERQPRFYGAIDKFSDRGLDCKVSEVGEVGEVGDRRRLQIDSKRSALNGVTSTNGSSPVISDAISRPVTAPSVKP
ncbi:hypothetical protein ABH944_003266 [Caballeronia udeis]|uniref:Uncharacterized protein n=1 Tax=Caballeronia udeis TaxID=1232866 RepID=A0ABW8MJJ1_9BURK